MKKLLLIMALCIFSVLSLRLFPEEFGTKIMLVEIFGLMFTCVLSIFFFKATPYKAASYVVLGTFLAIVIDLLLFPTVNGYERNLFPIEIAIHVTISVIISYVLALLWSLLLKNDKK